MARLLIRPGLSGAIVFALALGAYRAEGQAPPPSSTLRYGSGYLDVPVAAVLPGLAFRANASGLWVRSEGDPEVDPSGAVTDPGGPRSSFHGDASFSLGILGRGELGATVQSLSSRRGGGRLMGGFGRLLILDPTRTGLGLAVGGRWLGSPDFGDGIERAPTRLGFPDRGARRRFTDGRELDTRLTLYGVASLQLPGVEAPWLPPNQVTFSVGYGNGMFREGGDLPWYAPPGLDGWFLGGGMDFELGSGTLLTLEAEHAGFDVNLGAEVVRGGARVGVHLLGANHDGSPSAYRSRKVGISLSLTACPLLRRACEPRLPARAAPDTVRLPAPPPDTVVVVQGLSPEGTYGRPVPLCLATGEEEWVLVTAAGDTLVGSRRRPLRSFPPGEGLPGTYALEDSGFDPGAPLRVDGVAYAPLGETVEPACAALRPWRSHGSLSLFRLREAADPPEVVYLPLRPGLWQRYRRIS